MPPLRIATINTNGIRAAYRKGMGAWLEGADVDILAIQEVRASTEDLEELLGPQWDILHDPATAKGRAGVALASRAGARARGIHPPRGSRRPRFRQRRALAEADYEVDGSVVTVVSTYVHSGEDGTPNRWRSTSSWMRWPRGCLSWRRTPSSPWCSATSTSATGSSTSATGRATARTPGSCPRSAPTSTGSSGRPGGVTGVDGSVGPGLGWVDVGRRWAGEVDGPYTWWSWRGKAFDTDTGWRLDYHVATPALAGAGDDYRVDRAESGISDGRTTRRSSSTTPSDQHPQPPTHPPHRKSGSCVHDAAPRPKTPMLATEIPEFVAERGQGGEGACDTGLPQ